ncbi:hypothetical protein A1OE_121 [Candidatus Endolissoclinum faulkneri L2]|uniref:Uncharacterized protein n=1 Tax=Candidatus Endolissoclinum faulkneri L2 TaxID=1193729 RepID=K7YLG5_9PROT|nr:hypothetical protein A1OE_121 [Candidatus Endolissoclinum faulkneri L2]
MQSHFGKYKILKNLLWKGSLNKLLHKKKINSFCHLTIYNKITKKI